MSDCVPWHGGSWSLFGWEPLVQYDFDVIVVGGGFAGAVAARELTNRGLRTVVVEARDRLGGRTWTRPFRGHAVELGGTWVHWWQPHVFAELSRYGIGLTEMPAAVIEMWADDGGPHVAADDGSSFALDRAMAKFWSAANVDFGLNVHDPAWGAGFEDVPVSLILDECDLTAEERASLSGCLASLANGPNASSSLATTYRWWVLAGARVEGITETMAKYSISGGTVALHAAIVADGDPTVVLSSPVSRITYGGDSVEVEVEVEVAGRAGMAGTATRYTARAVISTVPFNVLPDVEFVPPLPDRLRASAGRGHTGRGLKVVMAVTGFPEATHCVADDTQPFTDMIPYKLDADADIYVAFGPRADAIDLSDRGSVEKALHAMAPSAVLVDYVVHDWTNDPHSRGTWTFHEIDQGPGVIAESQRPLENLILAGDATAGGWNGFIDGAIESGLRAARQAEAVLSRGR